jgi:DNA-directed RNA polymerase specialized sigma24 family protein
MRTRPTTGKPHPGTGCSPRSRKLLRLLVIEPAASYAEAAAALDMPVGSLGPTRARCLDTLRRYLAVLTTSEGGNLAI